MCSPSMYRLELLGWLIHKGAICTRIAPLWISTLTGTARSLIWWSQVNRNKLHVVTNISISTENRRAKSVYYSIKTKTNLSTKKSWEYGQALVNVEMHFHVPKKKDVRTVMWKFISTGARLEKDVRALMWKCIEMYKCLHFSRLVPRLHIIPSKQCFFFFIKKNSQEYGTSPRQSGNVLRCRRLAPVRPCAAAHSVWIILRSTQVFARNGGWYTISQKSVPLSLYRVNLAFCELSLNHSTINSSWCAQWRMADGIQFLKMLNSFYTMTKELTFEKLYTIRHCAQTLESFYDQHKCLRAMADSIQVPSQFLCHGTEWI